MRSLILLSCLTALAWGQPAVRSPDGLLEMTISADNGKLAYAVTYRGKPVIAKSGMALDIQDQQNFGPNVRIAGARTGAVNETYNMLHGKSNPVRNACQTLAVDVEETGRQARRMTIEVRAYDDGVAFRYVLPSQPALMEMRLAGEKTEFQLAKDSTTYPLILENFRTPYEDGYHIMPLGDIHKD